MTDRDLVAHVVADTTADPFLQSIARVVPKAAKRLGYSLIGVCRHCTDAVITPDPGTPWVHRGHGTSSCLMSRSRA